VDYQKICLKDVEKLEIGPDPAGNQQGFFKSSSNPPKFHILRIYYKLATDESASSVSGTTIVENALTPTLPISTRFVPVI
jgi:hypothetical protein